MWRVASTWMKRSGIQGFAALIIPYSATLYTGYVTFQTKLMVRHGVISAEPGCWRDVFLYGDVAGSLFRCAGATRRATAKRISHGGAGGTAFHHRRHCYSAGSLACCLDAAWRRCRLLGTLAGDQIQLYPRTAAIGNAVNPERAGVCNPGPNVSAISELKNQN